MNLASWLSSRKKLLQVVKAQVYQHLGHQSQDLEAYHKCYREGFAHSWRLSNEKDLRNSLLQADFVLGGDFHAFGQSQRTHLREWRKLVERSRPLIIALECVESKHQKWLNLYMRRKISENEFLSHIEWGQSWGFSWDSYRPLFEFARQKKILIYGLNKVYKVRSLRTLYQRDEHAARLLAKIKQQHPEALVYSIFGDLHLAEDHLPAALRRRCPESQVLVYYQNVDELYFRFFRRLQKSDLLKSSPLRFCRLSSPPWVKWQSYLMFLETQIDQDLEGEWEPIDLTDRVGELVRVLSRDLSLKVSINPLAVYSSVQETWLDQKVAPLSPRDRRILKHLIEKDRSFYLASHRSLYLSRLSINHAATLAGWYIHGQMCQRATNLWNQPRDFLPLIWCEAVGFFFSKLINPKRKAEHPREMKLRLAGLSALDESRPALLLALEQRMSEVIWIYTGRERKGRLRYRKEIYYIEAANLLGQMLGERLFESYQAQRVSLATLKKWLVHPVDGKEIADFQQFYLNVIKRLESFRSSRWRGDLRAG